MPPPPRRPWWTYVAALLVVAMTVGSLVVAQRWYDDWLRTPDGLNHAHGTHFPTYTHGYRLTAVRDMVPGITKELTIGGSGAVALPCRMVGRNVHLSVLSDLAGSYLRTSCTKSFVRPTLTPFAGKASVTVVGGGRNSYPIAIYRKIARTQYPVATKDFEVQHDLSFDSVRKAAAGGRALPAVAANSVLTLHGTGAEPNGTFTGRLRLPSGADAPGAPMIRAVGLLSPTSTGTFRLRVQGIRPTTGCGEQAPTDTDLSRPDECSLVDKQVPQISYVQNIASVGDSVPVQITVEGARGPWTLQVVAEASEIGSGSAD